MTGSGCQNLPSPPVPHTDCVFRVQTHGHQTLQKESKEKELCVTDCTDSDQLHQSLQNKPNYLDCSMASHNERANNGYRAEQNSCPASGTSNEHIWVLFAGGASYSWLQVSRQQQQQQQQWSRKEESSSYGNPSPLCSLHYMVEDVLFDPLLNQCSTFRYKSLVRHLQCPNLH